MEGQDLRLAAPGEQQQAHGGHVQGASGLVPAQHCGEAAILLGCQEALGPPLPVAADAHAGVAVLRAVSPDLGLLHDDREDWRRAVRGGGRRVEPAEPGPHVLPGYLSDGPAREEGQYLPSEVGPVHVQGARLPAPPVALENLLGDRLEEGAAGVRRVGLPAVAQRSEHRPGPDPRLGLGDRCRVAYDLPDPFAPVLAMDEVAPGAGGQDPDAVPLELGVPDIAHLAAGPKGVDSALGESDGWHDRASPICCSGVRNGLEFRTRWH